jgi:hypothetical protein
MMIKNKIIAAVLSVAVLSAGSAFAIELDPKFYVGGEVLGSKLKAKDENINLKKRPGAAVFAGSRLNENFGLELGYSYLGKTNDVKNTNLSADVLGYLPVNESVDLIGSVGLGRLSSKAAKGAVLSNEKNTTSKVAPRLGLGAQYKFDNNVGVRAMARFQRGNDFAKNATSVGVGAFYQF